MRWQRARLFQSVWLLVLAGPFVSAILLAVSAISEPGSRTFRPSWAAANWNFREVLFGGDTSYEFLWSFGTSAVLCLGSAVLTVAIALPIAHAVGTRWRKHLWAVCAAAVGARVVPVTAPIPSLESLQHLLRLPNS